MLQILGYIAIVRRGRPELAKSCSLEQISGAAGFASGECSFLEKALRAVQAGAIALLIINWDDTLVSPTATGDDGSVQTKAASITIPIVSVRASDAPLLLQASKCKLVYHQAPAHFPQCIPEDSEQAAARLLNPCADIAELSSSDWLCAALEQAGLPSAGAAAAATRAQATIGVRLRRMEAALAAAEERASRAEGRLAQVVEEARRRVTDAENRAAALQARRQSDGAERGLRVGGVPKVLMGWCRGRRGGVSRGERHYEQTVFDHR
jgi:hypothetical protein